MECIPLFKAAMTAVPPSPLLRTPPNKPCCRAEVTWLFPWRYNLLQHTCVTHTLTHIDCSAPSVAPGDARASCTTIESATTSAKAVDSAAAVIHATALGTELARPAIQSQEALPVRVGWGGVSEGEQGPTAATATQDAQHAAGRRG